MNTIEQFWKSEAITISKVPRIKLTFSTSKAISILCSKEYREFHETSKSFKCRNESLQVCWACLKLFLFRKDWHDLPEKGRITFELNVNCAD